MKNKKALVLAGVAVACLLGVGAFLYARQASETRQIKAYTEALNDLAQQLERKNAGLTVGEPDAKRLREAIHNSKVEGENFKKLTPNEMDKLLLRYPDLDRARQRVNKAVEARGGP